jgi:hypothetical protein
MATMQQIRVTRGVPAKRGQRCRVNGKPGVIKSASSGSGYLRVLLDGMKHPMNCHPTWRFEYEVDGKFVGFGMED